MTNQVRRRIRKQYDCDRCKRSFSKNEHLVRHKRTHTLERPFICRFCAKSYPRQDTLRRHEQLHEDTDLDGNQDTADDALNPDSGTSIGANILIQSPVPNALPTATDAQQYKPSTIISNTLPPSNSTELSNDFGNNGINNPLFDQDPEWIYNFEDFQLPESFDIDIFADWLGAGWEPSTKNRTTQNSTEDRLNTSSFAEAPLTMRTLSNNWFTQAGPPSFPLDSGSIMRSGWNVDSNDRSQVQYELDTLPVSHVVPSVPFFNRCIGIYIEHFASLFPIIYLPTFQPSKDNAWLLVSMLAIGSQLVGTKEATTQGEQMYDSLHRSVVGSWTTLFNDHRDPVATLQAVVLGQAFALLSAQKRHLVTARAFQSTLRFCFEQLKAGVGMSSGLEPTRTARHASFAFIPRLDCTIRILDAELACLCHDSPTLRSRRSHAKIMPSDTMGVSGASEAVHQSASANSKMSRRSSTFVMSPMDGDSDYSMLCRYAELSDLLNAVMIKRYSLREENLDFQDLEDQLLRWFTLHRGLICTESSMHLRILWHSIWLAIKCDIDSLEIALGREGKESSQDCHPTASTWARTTQAKCAVMHAFAIRRIMKHISLAQIVAIHIPRCIYQAALVIFGVAKLSSSNLQLFPKNGWTGIEEHVSPSYHVALSSWLLDQDRLELEIHYNTPNQLEERALGFISLMRRSGPWGLCQNLADTLECISNTQVSNIGT